MGDLCLRAIAHSNHAALPAFARALCALMPASHLKSCALLPVGRVRLHGLACYKEIIVLQHIDAEAAAGGRGVAGITDSRRTRPSSSLPAAVSRHSTMFLVLLLTASSHALY